jgi:hypothetical protein
MHYDIAEKVLIETCRETLLEYFPSIFMEHVVDVHSCVPLPHGYHKMWLTMIRL